MHRFVFMPFLLGEQDIYVSWRYKFCLPPSDNVACRSKARMIHKGRTLQDMIVQDLCEGWRGSTTGFDVWAAELLSDTEV